MTIKTVGLLSPGDMGSAVGGVLREHGVLVLTCLQGRSERSRNLASQAGFEDVADLNQFVEQSEVILSIMVPSSALEAARGVAAAIKATGTKLLYVDCNAIAPRTVVRVGEAITDAGARVADVGIVGPPPRQPGAKFYASGPGAAEFAQLRDAGLDVRVLDGDMGQASGFKMCYGALTKGLQALGTELLVAARRMGIEADLRTEQQETVGDVLAWLEKSTPTMPPKAHRWVGEMEEIATCFADLGLTPNILRGASDMYRLIAANPIGRETPEERDRSRGLDGIIAAIADEPGRCDH
jgi:3-hydroxyisobutyrate dehydrogenase-like beta-hydroxyacid dehydrogenase